MCGREKSGVRTRCASSYSYAAAGRLNANRRTGRLARRRLSDHLRDLGMTATAHALMATPPSVLPALMAALDIDESVLEGVRMPDDRRRAACPEAIIALATRERSELAAESAVVRSLPVRRPVQAADIKCRSQLDTVMHWERSAEDIFAAGTPEQARAACAQVSAFCKGCPLLDRCAATAKETRYTGMAGGRVFVDGRHRVSPSPAARIVA